jgi:hypothetical protein
MLRNGEKITFRGVQRRSGLALDFLYTNTTIRTRDRNRPRRPDHRCPSPASTAHTRRRRRNRGPRADRPTSAAKRQYRIDTDELPRQLATAAGEILALRDRIRTLEHHLVGNPSPPA